jgi:hypothetical protein
LARAELTNYDYDFEMRARFTKFWNDLPWTLNSAMVVKQDVTIQISMGETQKPKSNMMDNVPIDFYVDGEPRLFSEGSGDPRVFVLVQGFHIYVTFVKTGIQVHIQVRPFVSDNHSGIMNGKEGTIPGSFSTYLCLPDDNPNIVGVKGLLGTPTADFTDDFMDVTGAQMSPPSNKNAYCIEHWCVKDEAESMFVYEDGYSFADYNGCGSSQRALEAIPEDMVVTVDDVSTEIVAICAKVDHTPSCLEEGKFNGAQGAKDAVKAILDAEKYVNETKSGNRPSDDACCSDDFKTCAPGCTESEYFCELCAEGEGSEKTFTYFFRGPGLYDATADQKFSDCLPEGSQCTTNSECCTFDDKDKNVLNKLHCEEGVCKAKDMGRRLEQFQVVRPDIPEERNIVPYRDEL